ncbi:MAG: neutral zinc metallopeptidase, partial [Alphaproteobacteria bacterium]
MTPDPGLDDIERIALDTIEALPEPWRAPARNVLLRVAEEAPREILDEMGIDDPDDLSGLYQGVP